MERAQTRAVPLFPRNTLDPVIIPPGEKPPPYDFSEVHGGLPSEDEQSSAERAQSTANHSSETRSTQTQPVTMMDPHHVGPVFIPVGGKLTDQAPFLMAMSVVFFFCGGFVPLIFFLKAWQAKRANDEPRYLRYRKWACNLSGIPIFVIMAVLFVVIVVVAVTLDNARHQTG